MANKFNLSKKLQAFDKVKKELPKVLANDSEKFFKQNFNKEGFQDGSFKKWKEVDRRIPGTPSYDYPKTRRLSRRTKKILSGKSVLKNATKAEPNPTFRRIAIVNSTDYAAVHNEGLRSGRGRGFKMPKRKFMGHSKDLEKIHLRKIKAAIDKEMK